MRKQTVFKKLLSSILVAIIVLGQFSGFNLVSEAATITTAESGSMYLSLSKTNKDSENPIGYANQNDKMIWNIMYSTNSAGTDEAASSNIYCIKAEDGVTWGTTPGQRVEYNWSETLNKDLRTTPSSEVNTLVTGEYFNEILWIIDNMYVPGESDKTKFLEQADIHYNKDDGYIYYSTNGHDYSEISGVDAPYGENTLTDDDIRAIQQAAIWYFTNYADTNYNYKGINSWLRYTTDGNSYTTFNQNVLAEKARDAHSYVLFNYLIDEAIAATANLANNTYELKKSTAKLWLSTTEGTDNEEQPVIEVHKIPVEPFDLSLRKAIVKVTDSAGNTKTIKNTNGEDATRNINIDTTNLNSEADTTAEYKHRKDPVVVEKGDTVTYSITIYNEGKEAGYANIIVDQLPGTWGNGLRLQNSQTEVESSTGNIYSVGYKTDTNTITLTMTDNSPKNVLAAYDGKNLASETILLDCVVMGKPDAANSKILTNIAYIAEEYNEYLGEMITTNTSADCQDRDSQTWNSPQYNANNLLTTEIGYTGKNNETNLADANKYYEGEQDDDDFEKLVILPEAFDLSLRKNITKVNGEEVKNDRTPVTETTNLDAGTETTAEYNHRKDAVAVKNGDTVEYNITMYNEGSIDGVSTIVKDQLPSGLKLDLSFFTKTGEEYTVTSTKGNVYKVSYDENNNVVTFKLDETKTVILLKEHKVGQELDKDIITLKCTVNCKPDDDQNTFLTNIAYIYEAKQEDGTVVTNQVAGTDNGSEADRDSQPHTYPEESATELKTTGDIGYTGKNKETDLTDANKYYEGEQDDDDFEKLVILPEAFDLSLRKNITKVNGEEVKNDRTPVTETTNLDAGTETTAEYNHRKDAVTVENGDTVEYNITMYNEGSIDGVSTIVKDQLPSGLKLDLSFFTKTGEEYTVTSTKGNVYKVSYDENNNVVTFKLDETKTVTLLKEHKVGQELDKDIITLKCTVNCKPDDDQNTFLTNIAYIYEAKQEDGTVVTNQVTGSDADRDSQPHTYPEESATELKTTGDIGYTGKNKETELSDANKYYEGEQDDDDFEKLVILPETFDLSLRKNITKVNGEEVKNDRTPVTETTNLDAGTETTAEYNHRKDAVTVENGDTVEYNITMYNEGSIDGVSTIVKDQLPSGLKLDLSFFTKTGEEYTVTSTKGNVYKVSYDENNNVVTFKLDETKTVTLLKAHEVGKKLDKDIITLKCTVNCQADDDQNIFLTNIAYIYEAKQEDGTVVTNQVAGSDADRDSQPHTYPEESATELKTTGDIGYTGKNNETDLSDSNKYYEGEQDDDDFEKLVILPKTFDLKLIKFITELNGELVGNRVISVDTSKLNSTSETTAEYILEKNPVSVKAGDFITYTLRVYNEGNYDGYATQISEDIPEGLEFIVIADGVIYSWDGKEQKDITEEIKASSMYEKIVDVNSNWGYDGKSSVITTNALSEDLLKGFGKEKAEYADKENNIDYAEVQVIFRVKDDVEANKIIRNEAAISQDKVIDNQGEELDIPDRDSVPEEWKKENSDKTYDEDGKWPIYEEDDEDYDNIITKTFDLSLRKQIIQINDVLYTNRYSKLDADNKYSNTLYDYYDVYNNKPTVKAGDKVVYSIRVYNEGEIDGYADLVVDSLPSGLEFVEYTPGDGSINDRYGWVLVEGTENQYQTDYLSYEKDANKGTANSTIIKAYDGQGQADYQELYIECKVRDNATKEDSLLNVAQIAEDSDSDGKDIKDKDSNPGKTDDETKWKEEDDLDIEILELQEFDLALRKFITAIENGEETEEVTTRIPQVSYNEETKQLVYTHPKDALVVHVGDTVIYTLRVYNEGDIDGYASEIKDDIPEYLEYLPEHSTNVENEWVMYDKDGNVTENVEEAVCIRTEHLAKGKGVEANQESKETNLIKAFNPNAEISETNPDYKEIKVAFKVKDPNSTEYEIVNFAQISEDSDSKGEPIDDRDSEPDNGEEKPKEDDEDIEKVKVEYFDLSLLKYVTKVLINENGQERVIETGNVGDENDIIPHVQINKKNIDKTVVKFVYSIKITNEGQIAGEATEITDYVPEGLVFVAEDNELWTDEGNNVISTKQLTGSILQPGESIEVEVVLRWINGDNNLGPKTNIAEISEDYNEENVPDRDSTPDNKKEGEDDIDDATVLLSINQGGGIQAIYINLIITFLGIILVGGILIKKFVL